MSFPYLRILVSLASEIHLVKKWKLARRFLSNFSMLCQGDNSINGYGQYLGEDRLRPHNVWEVIRFASRLILEETLFVGKCEILCCALSAMMIIWVSLLNWKRTSASKHV